MTLVIIEPIKQEQEVVAIMVSGEISVYKAQW